MKKITLPLMLGSIILLTSCGLFKNVSYQEITSEDENYQLAVDKFKSTLDTLISGDINEVSLQADFDYLLSEGGETVVDSDFDCRSEVIFSNNQIESELEISSFDGEFTLYQLYTEFESIYGYKGNAEDDNQTLTLEASKIVSSEGGFDFFSNTNAFFYTWQEVMQFFDNNSMLEKFFDLSILEGSDFSKIEKGDDKSYRFIFDKTISNITYNLKFYIDEDSNLTMIDANITGSTTAYDIDFSGNYDFTYGSSYIYSDYNDYETILDSTSIQYEVAAIVGIITKNSYLF